MSREFIVRGTKTGRLPQGARTTVPRSHDFTQDRESWERSVFLEATEFTSALVGGGVGGRSVNRYGTLAEALADASSPERRDKWGRRPLVYAVTPQGRSVCLDEKDWPMWRKLDKERVR